MLVQPFPGGVLAGTVLDSWQTHKARAAVWRAIDFAAASTRAASVAALSTAKHEIAIDKGRLSVFEAAIAFTAPVECRQGSLRV